MKKILVLDIDGVLNDHRPLPNGYSQMKLSCVKQFCRILETCPDVEIVLSSAWRYLTFGDIPPMSLRGFEYLMCLFGAPYYTIHNRIIGTTASDEAMCIELGITEEGVDLDYLWLKENGYLLRREQILRATEGNYIVVLDDLDLEMPELIKTDGNVGLTKVLADQVIDRFQMTNL
jgi:hypothetical protein